MPLLYYQITTKNAVNRNLAGVFNNWNNWTSGLEHIELILIAWFECGVSSCEEAF